MEIKTYNTKYKEQVQQICINTGPEKGLSDKNLAEAVINIYCNYYIEQEPNNCFVLVDENDVAQGYIICSSDPKKFSKGMKSYIKKAEKLDKKTAIEAKFEILAIKLFSFRYPAHMHIDINEGYRRNGNGTKLVERLVAHLRKANVKGIMLAVGSWNTDGIRFYKRNGFKTILPAGEAKLMAKNIEEE